MLAKAHITVGMAAAFTVIMPEDAAEALPVIAGASLGCLICDIDCDNAAERTDSSHWRKVMACIAAVSLAADHLLDAGMWRTLAQSSAYVWAAGIAVFVLTCAFASVSSHRGFSHSLAALALEAEALEDAALDDAPPPHAVSTPARASVMASAAIFPIVFMLDPFL